MYKKRKGWVADVNTLRSLAKMWQKRLNLSDWDVVVNIARKDDMPEESQGACHYQAVKKQAIIQVIHPDDYEGGGHWNQDMERTLVHELLHLHFAEKTPYAELSKDYLELVEERVIEATSQALVDLRRGE